MKKEATAVHPINMKYPHKKEKKNRNGPSRQNASKNALAPPPPVRLILLVPGITLQLLLYLLYTVPYVLKYQYCEGRPSQHHPVYCQHSQYLASTSTSKAPPR